MAWDAQSILYLDTYLTKYGFGTVGYLNDIDNAIVYHQWFSGRISSLEDKAQIDGCLVKTIRDQLNEFLNDYRKGKADFKCVKLTSRPGNYIAV